MSISFIDNNNIKTVAFFCDIGNSPFEPLFSARLNVLIVYVCQRFPTVRTRRVQW